MNTSAHAIDPIQAEATYNHRNYLNTDYTLKSWLFTVDHKRIALMYMVAVSIFFIAGGLLAMAVRFELLTPQADLMSYDTYNKVFTMHGVVMVFFVMIPAVPAILGNFLVPLMVRARAILPFQKSICCHFTYTALPRSYCSTPLLWEVWTQVGPLPLH